MASPSTRVAGTLFVKVDGEQQFARGGFTYNLGEPKRTSVLGADGVHGYKEEPQVAFIEGSLTDRGNLDVKKLVNKNGATITLECANGKVVSLSNAWFAGEGTVDPMEGSVAIRFEAAHGDES